MTEVALRESLYGFEYREHDKRRKESTADRKIYDVKQLWQRHHEIINLAALGYKNVDIARILNVTPTTISATLNGRLGQLKLSQRRKERDAQVDVVTEKIKLLTEKALNVYQEIFEDETIPRIKKKDVADTVMLELSGRRAATKVATANFNISGAELEEFKKRGLQATKDSGLIIDAEIEE